MNTAQDSQFMVAQLLRVTEKEARYLERTAARLRSQTPDLAWAKSLEDNDERSEMLDGVQVLTATQLCMAAYAQKSLSAPNA
jgi:hypothetical protein